LLTGDAAAGIDILDRQEERGRDPRALLDQVVEAVRARLVAEAGVGSTDRAASLTGVARRLVAIDPDRAGIGGLRLQLELALFAGPRTSAAPQPAGVAAAGVEPASQAPHPVVPVAPPTPVEPAPRVAAPSQPAPQASAPAEPEQRSERTEAPIARPRDRTPSRPAEPAVNGSPAPDAEPGTLTVPAMAEPKDAPAVTAGPPPATSTAASAAAPPATSAAAPPETNGGELSLDRILATWPEIVAVLSRQPVIKPLILTCRPVALDGVIVTLGFPEEQAFLREIAERKKAGIEAGIREVIGRDIGVRCVVANIEVPAPATGADDGFLMAEARRIFGDDLADVVEID
jgi:hypothetical protein